MEKTFDENNEPMVPFSPQVPIIFLAAAAFVAVGVWKVGTKVGEALANRRDSKQLKEFDELS